MAVVMNVDEPLMGHFPWQKPIRNSSEARISYVTFSSFFSPVKLSRCCVNITNACTVSYLYDPNPFRTGLVAIIRPDLELIEDGLWMN